MPGLYGNAEVQKIKFLSLRNIIRPHIASSDSYILSKDAICNLIFQIQKLYILLPIATIQHDICLTFLLINICPIFFNQLHYSNYFAFSIITSSLLVKWDSFVSLIKYHSLTSSKFWHTKKRMSRER